MDYDKQFQQENFSIIEIKTLKKIFEDRSSKSTITLSCKCSGCGNDLLVDITYTAGGFGFNGGLLIEYGPGKYFVKCHNCYNLDKRILRI
jgi:hypothetical protein